MRTVLRLIAILASTGLLLAGCGANTIKPDPAALHGDYSGKDVSGSFAVIRAAGDIPGVPQSKGKQARWSATEIQQVLYLDANCQKQLFDQLPGTMQALVKEGGWSALAMAIGEGLFATAFPGAEVGRYALGGLGYGAAAGANTGRYRQDGSEKASVGYCVLLQVYEAKNRYHILPGIHVVPWYGNGQTTLPKAASSTNAPTLPYVRSNEMPLPGH